MINKNSLGILGQFYFNIKESFKSIYQNSNLYEKKISNVGKCRFFGRFGTLYALASWKVEKAFLR